MKALALSLSWHSEHHASGKELIKEVLSLGFDNFELSFNLTKDMVEEILREKEKRGFNITSLHNYCPMPDGMERKKALPDCVSLASLDDTERKAAVNLTKRSIDTATRFNAKVLVLHCGRVEIEDETKTLMKLYREGNTHTPEYKELKKRIIEDRQSHKGPFLNKALESLDELSDYAAKNNIFLGIENRIYYREIPSLDEVEVFLDKFQNRNVRYWHDVGHAEVFERLGLGKHQDYLDRYKDKLIGFHLHDVDGIKDHRAPAKGSFDFKKLIPYVRKSTIKVLEPHIPATGRDLIEAEKYLTQIFDGAL